MRGPPDSLGRTAAPRRGRRLLTALAAAFALSLAACASIDPPPAPVSVAPAAAPRAVAGVPAGPERKRLIDAFGGVYSAPATEAYLNGVLVKLAPASDAGGQPYRVTMLNSPIVNAFALPSGDIFVTRGLLALADDTSEIAAVMAHEIGHITARHAAQRAEFEKTTALFTQGQHAIARPAPGSGRGRGALEAGDRQLFPPAGIRGRPDRHQDHREGRIRPLRGGAVPHRAWRVERASRFGLGRRIRRPPRHDGDPSVHARAHRPGDRGSAASSARREAGEVDRDGYLAAIDGLAFGDDPSQGIVRDNAFIHPKLGFAFDAPDGFTLDNQSAALIGVGEAGGEALRLDSVAIAESTPVASAIGSGWIDGVKTTAIEPKQIAGLEAATAVAQGQQWSFRLGAIRLNGRLYRLIFAAHALSPAVNSRFMASLDSFHLINAQDSALAAPQRIKIVEAGSGDTAETLAARMAFLPRPVDQFMILNGLERGAALVPGQRYKIIAQ